MAVEKSRVEIGYLETGEKFKLESRFFPSKVGGKPAWLDLKNISVDLSCGVCSNTCLFLCQLYAPIAEERAYHRTIFIFVCRNPECCQENRHDNFKVYRCQLPRNNIYYAAEEPSDLPNWHPESAIERFNVTCIVCGSFAFRQCDKCKNANYCSSKHQNLHWEWGHDADCGEDNERQTYPSLLFPEYEIKTELEMMSDEEDDDREADLGKKLEKSDEDKMEEYQELLKEGKAGTCQDVSSEFLEKLAFGKEDKFLKNFKVTLSKCPDQVIRYEKGGEPLWISRPNETQLKIPHCEFCQAPREFEFQVLPTLLTYMNVDSLGKSIDWGTLLVYTCKNSCDEGPVYKREYLWKQDVS